MWYLLYTAGKQLICCNCKLWLCSIPAVDCQGEADIYWFETAATDSRCCWHKAWGYGNYVVPNFLDCWNRWSLWQYMKTRNKTHYKNRNAIFPSMVFQMGCTCPTQLQRNHPTCLRVFLTMYKLPSIITGCQTQQTSWRFDEDALCNRTEAISASTGVHALSFQSRCAACHQEDTLQLKEFWYESWAPASFGHQEGMVANSTAPTPTPRPFRYCIEAPSTEIAACR